MSRKQRARIFDQCLRSVTITSSSSTNEYNSTNDYHETTESTISVTQEQDLPYPSGWFLQDSKNNGDGEVHPSRQKLKEWLLWALFPTSHTPEAIELYKEELETYVERIEGNRLQYAHMNVRVQEETFGSQEGTAVFADNETADSTSYSNSSSTEDYSSNSTSTHRSMRVTVDPVEMLHRPLIWYFVSLVWMSQ